ncbi:hypothetical protein ACFU8R_09190 [Pseudonocardia alni]|uniref:hypothetical protein n=1 Tax=Pseudonocardia alni TaxID=33907 RepID=UPI003686258D
MSRNGPYERYYAEREASGQRTVLWPWVLLALVVPLLLVRSFVVADEPAGATATHQAAPAPAREAGQGVHRAGTDIEPGTWATDGPGSGAECGYTRTAADGVEVASARLHGAAAARFLDGESVVLTGGCTWTAD